MILFYYVLPIWEQDILALFQFHYDLILLLIIALDDINYLLFQFHYDLILLIVQELLYDYEALFQFHYDLILL